MQTVQILIRPLTLQILILLNTICQYAFDGTPGINGLSRLKCYKIFSETQF